MGRSLRAAVVERPAWRRGPLAVEGPDEDAFTLAVSVLEELQARPGFAGTPFSRVQVVGPFPAERLADLGEALGDVNLEVRRSAGGASELYAALATATGSGASDGLEAVVAVDRAGSGTEEEGGPTHGAGAVAFGISEGMGLRVGPHGERNHPPEHRPDAHAWVRTVRKALPADDSPQGALRIRAERPPPVLLAFWTRELPKMAVVPFDPPDPTLGPAPHLGPAIDLIAAAEAGRAGAHRLIANIRADRTVFAGFLLEGSLETTWLPSKPTLPLEAPTRREKGEPTISEGAYVPRLRYLESRPSRWRLIAERCGACSRLTFPARGFCRFCDRSEGLTREALPRDGGTVEALTTVRPGAQPSEFDEHVRGTGGYDVVLVRLAPEVLGTFQVTDRAPGTTVAGARVRTKLRRLYETEGEPRYGRKALPESPSGAG